MSSPPTRESFARRLHTKFAMHADESQPIDLELIDVRGHGASVTYESFSLMFRAPVEAPARQGSYRLEHESLEAMDVFLVPVKKDHSGLFFEAVFNYLPARA
jgi:hypothetical protein